MSQARAILTTLDALRPALERIAGPWCVIGSAALVLHGIGGVVAQDIDLMLDADDAAMLVDRAGFVRLPRDATGFFVSEIYARRDDLALTVEVMGGFCVRHPRGPCPVHVGAPMLCDGWPVASLPDLAAMFRLFDRPKDRMRLDLIPNH